MILNNKFAEFSTEDLLMLLKCEYLWEEEKEYIFEEIRKREDQLEYFEPSVGC